MHANNYWRAIKRTKEGDRLILTPIRKNHLLDLMASWEPLDEGLPEVEDTPPETRAEL